MVVFGNEGYVRFKEETVFGTPVDCTLGDAIKQRLREGPPSMQTDIDVMLNERGKHYGDFRENAMISQQLKTLVRAGQYYHDLTYAQKEAIDNILQKIARCANGGDPEYLDSWLDIIGYAQLVVDDMRKDD